MESLYQALQEIENEGFDYDGDESESDDSEIEIILDIRSSDDYLRMMREKQEKVAKRPELIKTKMCTNIAIYGRCTRKVCTFAHNERELCASTMENKRPDLEKTKMCANIAKYGKCTRKICTFAHSKEELRIPVCIHGDKCPCTCRYQHI
jgi:hypothetical protein